MKKQEENHNYTEILVAGECISYNNIIILQTHKSLRDTAYYVL